VFGGLSLNLLIGLAAKNGILLIVEFAKEKGEQTAGRPPRARQLTTG
jgi:hypothetical protein